MAEANVVCRQLHFPGAKSVVTGQEYGVGSGPIWLDDINCEGTEDYLSTCAFKGWGVTDCTHKEDAGVICETESSNWNNTDSTHWLDHSFTLSDDLGKIFDSGNGCDFTISVNSATGNKQEDGTMEMMETTICAHKMILSQFPLFDASENTNISVDVSEACQPYFTPFIRYLYTRKIDVTMSSVQCLHWMASKFGVKQLMEETGRLFSKVLPEDTSFQTQVSICKYAEETEDMVLKENCLQFLAWNFEKLTQSPAWGDLTVKLIGSLLRRSDLVVPDEYFLFQTVESWITKQSDSISSENQIDLLNRIRFPMIPAEKLYDLESNSSLYSTFKQMFQEKMLKAYQFNVLLFSRLSSKFNTDDDYLSRIYTAKPWSISFSETTLTSRGRSTNQFQRRRGGGYGSSSSLYYPSSPWQGQTSSKSFSTPIHNSLMFTENKIQWEANVFKQQYDCSNRGVSCQSLPMARLVPQSRISQSNILFRNRLLLLCQGSYICHVQDFKVNVAYIAANDTQLAYPCPDDQYTYQFVVRPEYV
ncbi:hypothetical protein INR49_018105 [Caranx melampygus]|nr:hypothetical protein INR49_018105 [Caranx melampygus]